MADVDINTTRLREALRLCVDALNESDPIHDDYWAAAKAGEDALAETQPPAGSEPFAFCCSSFEINACDCVNKNHGTAKRG